MGNYYHIAFFIFSVLFSIHSYSQPQEANLIGRWFDPSIPGSVFYNNAYNEVWGVSVNDVEYGIIGSTLGTHFINLSDPSNPVEDFFIEGAFAGDLVVHRDYHDFNGYLFAVCDEDIGSVQSTLQIMDISMLPDTVTLVYDSNELIRKAHNIYIDSSRARLYALAAPGGDWPYSAAKVYDIADPVNPVLLERFDEFDGIDIGHVHDGFVLRDTAYLNCGYDGFAIVDFTDIENEKVLSFLSPLDYPESGYNHSGWLSEDGKYYYMADETWGQAMKVLDVADKTAISSLGIFDAGSESPYSIPHNLIVHCDHLYVAHYYDGLQIYKLEDPSNPERVLFYPTSSIPHKDNYEGAWGVYPFLPSGLVLVSDMQEGLFILEGPESNCGETSSTDEANVKLSSTKVFPNPASDYINISSEASIGAQVQLVLYNSIGQIIHKDQFFNNGSFKIDLNDLKESSGIHMLHLFWKNQKKTYKIWIE